MFPDGSPQPTETVDVELVIALPAGEAHIGEVGVSSGFPVVTPAITAGAYTAEDIIGAIQTLANASRIDDKEVILQSIIITDLGKQNAGMDIFFFNQDPTNGTYTDNIPLDIDDVDMPFCIGVVSIAAGDYKDSADSSVGVISNIGLGMLPIGSDDIYAIAKVVDAPTYISVGDLTFKYFFLQD